MSDLTTPVVKKRRRRTKQQIEALDELIVAALSDDHPQSIRHVFYRMTNPRLPEHVEKTEHGYKQVQARITRMRRDGRVPYGWITDATRRGYHTATYADGSDFLRRVAGLYRADLWRNADTYVEVWCESRSIAGVIEDDCRELAVSLYPAGGFSSITLAYQSAEFINTQAQNGRPVVILYIGDYDPAGVLIDQSIERELREHLTPGLDLAFHRIGITSEQIVEFDLPTKPRKEGDKRARHIQETVEAEAMPASSLRRLLRDSVESYLPPDALQVARAAESSEREYLTCIAEAMEV